MPTDEQLIQNAVSLAEAWQKRANALLTRAEKRKQNQMQRLLTHPLDKVILTKMMDQGFRSGNHARVADQVSWTLKRFGIPQFFSPVEQALMHLFVGPGKFFPGVSVPKMIEKMRADSNRVIIAGEHDVLFPHLEARRRAGVRMNLNHLGEAVLGDDESLHRLETYLADLASPEIEYISVKISTIYSQISSLAFEKTVEVLVERLSRLYRVARDHFYTRNDGIQVPKFVNLDMEEYRDLEITAAAFVRALDQSEFKHHSAGIVLQAYVPDSYAMQKDLTAWARNRVADGGAPIKVRIVKGANMEMEQVESALFNWPLAPYDNKRDVDANYKRMVDFAMIPENIQAVHLGVASHNLFDLAYACCLAQKNDVTGYFTFEMLEGMADHVRRAIQEISGEVLLYAPVATRDQFINAIAYLIRRLDENTAPENFLRHSFGMTVDSPQWRLLRDQFIEALAYKEAAPQAPNRIQDRSSEAFALDMGTFSQGEFVNEPDTDWSLAANRRWAEQIRRQWMGVSENDVPKIPVVVGGEELTGDRACGQYFDPSRYAENILVARYTLADEKDARRAAAVAKADPDNWRQMTPAQRHEVLSRVAMRLRHARGDLIGTAAVNTGKLFTESDPEVSEAIDFAEYYPFSVRAFEALPNIAVAGKGVGLVVSPWNFPIAIPCGGMLAALAAGNTVIFKPATAAVLPAWQVCQCFWEAGVSKNTLQFLPCAGSSTGRALVNHPDVDFVILTGGTDTGLAMLKDRPDLQLAAETGGKNATIVTAMSDRDQAIKNILHSAFSNTGQKCSATSLVILEREVYEDPLFKKQLVDAAKSLKVGSAWAFENKLGPLIGAPSGDLKRALTQLEPGESWALKPQMVDGNPMLWSPGIKYGVQPGSYTHMTEFFGPVIGVMRADDLAQAIALVNQTGYGLTSGLESLDVREQALWKETIKAGNLYINRGTTGAIVLRQPFGGMGKSAFGAGIKAGGPNYVAQFMNVIETAAPAVGAISADHRLLRVVSDWAQKLHWGQWLEYEADLTRTIRAVKSYLYQMDREFSREKDYFHLRGQDNLVRYLPVGEIVIRLHEKDSLFDALARIAAAAIAGCRLQVSLPAGCSNAVTRFITGRRGRRFVADAAVARHTDAELIAMMPVIDRIRYAGADRVPAAVFEAAAKTGFYIARSPVLMEGRLELIHYFREQSISDNYHRYGNLAERALI
jgi:RHH-type proline utilization regulon transcriptional repressor/proline dehydrogenase/delta 1-pyrroline-5-carboxylate dehydrogenase